MAEPESLAAALDRVYRALTRDQQAPADGAPTPDPVAASEPWHALERLRVLFGLSPFERDLLVLCAGHSLQGRFAAACAVAQADPRATWPTFGLALTVLDDPHWSALSAARPLRYWHLIEVGDGGLLQAPLQVDERILAFLLGVPAVDERLSALVRPMLAEDDASPSEDGSVSWDAISGPLLLVGEHRSVKESAFTGICRRCGLAPYYLDANDIPASATEREQLARLWTREAAMTGAALYLRTQDCDSIRDTSAWLSVTDAPVAIEVRPGTPAEQLDGARLTLPAMTTAERRGAWTRHLGPLAGQMDGYLDRIAEYFDFEEPAIRLAASAVRAAADATKDHDLGRLGWRICREHARRRLDTLAHRIEARACWADLILPDSQIQTLNQIAIHVRRRAIVNDRWGFAARHARGRGLTALFAGASGTGKTMAAEILAAELDLDLYKVDLASVVSKYIGETEKNLRAIFDAAQRSGAILLFDEADALFGKRSEVRDSHDRYANLEISYLLQQMESYRGVAILTTNMQHAIDPAFLRRIRFVIQFPFPDPAARARIWHSIFPSAAPLAGIDFDVLAQMNVAGGTICNIATNAAFLAADDGMIIQPRHILAAARTEYAKLGKPLTTAETRGFQ